jgi:hypothetical protein
MLFQKPANPLVDGVRDFLDGKFIAERDPFIVMESKFPTPRRSIPSSNPIPT